MSLRAAVAFAIVFGAMAVCAAVTASSSRTESTTGAPPSILLVSHGRPENVGVYGSLIGGLVLVQSESQLEQRVDSSTRAILIDRSIAGELSPPFLERELASGVVLYGLNISSNKLVAIADWDEAYKMKFSRPPGPEVPRGYDAPPYESYYSFIEFDPHGVGSGLGRLDILGGMLQIRLGLAAGLACHEGRPWTDCSLEIPTIRSVTPTP